MRCYALEISGGLSRCLLNFAHIYTWYMKSCVWMVYKTLVTFMHTYLSQYPATSSVSSAVHMNVDPYWSVHWRSTACCVCLACGCLACVCLACVYLALGARKSNVSPLLFPNELLPWSIFSPPCLFFLPWHWLKHQVLWWTLRQTWWALCNRMGKLRIRIAIDADLEIDMDRG